MSAYAELAATTNFSFLRGASHPQEMVARADELGLAAIGIADRNSLAGVVRAYDEARKRKIKLLVGARLVTVDGFETLVYPTDREAYGRLCQLLTTGNLKARKSECHLAFEDILGAAEGQIFIALSPIPSSPVETGEGDHASETKHGGGGVAASASLSLQEKHRCQRPSHHPSRYTLRMVPLPAVAGRDDVRARPPR